MPTAEAHEWTPLRIKELRIRLGKTQQEFADIINGLSGRNINRARIAQWEGGFHRPMLFWLEHFRDLDRMTPPLRGSIVDYRKVLEREEVA
jgi:transcriptional regulator with XRE-family HTH domain